ncbi:hypothetical protein GF376_03060 [Candidatus Peregrinibacteria bacterium]|nr:hypothetical protein [Candidatus Peregrinibacteria bacterium]
MRKYFIKTRFNQEDAELRKLADRLSEPDLKAELPETDQVLMKAHLMRQFSQADEKLPRGFDKVVNCFKNMGASTGLNQYQKIRIKDRVLDFAEANDPQIVIGRFLPRLRFVMAALMIMVLGLSSFTLVPNEFDIARAAKWTFIEAVEGEVYVNRGGILLAVSEEFNLREGDIVITQDDSFVVIRFLDDSVTRLDNNSSLRINKLYFSPENFAKTEVNVKLEEGQAWTRVINLVEDSEFVVETDDAKASVQDRASFEIVKEDVSTSLIVFDNVVDVSKKEGMIDNVKPVVSGFKAEISSDKLVASNHDILVEESKDQVSEWAELNINLDEDHREKLLAESKVENQKVLAEDKTLIKAASDFKSNTFAIFNDPDLELTKNQFVEAHIGFLRAQNLLNDGKRTEALAYLYDYKNTINEIDLKLPELMVKDREKTRVLENMIKESLALQRKKMELVFPDDKLYPAKKNLMEIDFGFRESVVAKVDNLVAKAKTRLAEVEHLVNRSKFDEARSAFEVYLRELDQLVALVDLNKEGEIQADVFDLFSEQINQLKSLNAIERKLRFMEDFEMASMVRDVIDVNIDKLMLILSEYKDKEVPFRLIQELESLVDNYVYEQKRKFEVSIELKDKMQDYPEYKLISEDQKLFDFDKENITESIIVDKKSTAEIESARVLDFELEDK